MMLISGKCKSPKTVKTLCIQGTGQDGGAWAESPGGGRGRKEVRKVEETL